MIKKKNNEEWILIGVYILINLIAIALILLFKN